MMKIYKGMDAETGESMFATVTGVMADGSLVYTKVEMGEGYTAVFENGEPKLILDEQYIRRTKYGCNTFHRL